MAGQLVPPLRRELRRYLRRFDRCFTNSRTRAHLPVYVEGQLGALERKSIEPVALDAGVPPRTLQEFLGLHQWDEDLMRRCVAGIIQEDHGHDEAIAVIDETTVVKKGNMTAGVQRQYCGSTGKVENCVATVHLGFVGGGLATLVDGDLFLPSGWAEDEDRRRKAKIPREVLYRPKWQIALDILTRTSDAGVRFRWLTADEGYGRVTAFREAVAARGLMYVVEIPNATMGWTSKPVLEPLPRATELDGTPRNRVRLGDRKARKVSALWERGGPSWKMYRVKDTDKGPAVWEVRETVFYPQLDGLPGTQQRLLVAHNVMTGEVKYFLANAPSSIPVKILLTVAFSRWNIERNFEDSKGEVGLDHFEVRQYRAIIRHLAISNVSMLFLAEQTARLRGGKSVVDLPAGEAGDGCAGQAGTQRSAEVATAGSSGPEDLVLAETGVGRRRLAYEAATTRTQEAPGGSASDHEMSFTTLAL